MYDGSDQAVSCSIDDQNEGKVCTVNFYFRYQSFCISVS